METKTEMLEEPQITDTNAYWKRDYDTGALLRHENEYYETQMRAA